MVALEFENVSKAFGSRKVLCDLSFALPEGQTYCAIGPSGGGKSTLARLATGLEVPDGGKITLFGQDGRKLRGSAAANTRGMIFQHFNLFDHLTALQNAMLAPVKVLKLDPRQAEQRATLWLRRVGLGEHLNHKPEQMSGGQQQRAALARALCMEPRLLVLDEPTSALDPELVSEVQTLIAALANEGRTLLVITHDMNFARRIADQVLFIEGGTIIEQGTADQVLDRPQTPRAQTFLRALKGEGAY